MKVYKADNGKKKISALAICLLLTVVLTVGGTLAYLFTSTDPIVNTFVVPSNGLTIDEDFNGTTKSNVIIQNTGDVDSFVRAKVIVTWQNAENMIYVPGPIKDTHYTMVYGRDWSYNETDGFYYYNKIVKANDDDPAKTEDQTTSLLTAEWIAPCDDTSYVLHIEILTQSIQAEPTSAVQNAWGFVPATN